MELKIADGKYQAGKYSGLETAEGAEELAGRIMLKLTARRGGFAPRPDYGSRLYMLPKVKPSQREGAARQYIAEALEGETGVELSQLAISEPENGRLELSMTFSAPSGGFVLVTEV